ncbi:hypothetical protein VP01_514g3 [Puccinia sorghi]|uniref:Uncharacterized protein n=1 Tax=Puccinia sorghi TaxID=27349 RepID=A0A0L6UKZ5_9BASI|nr:hypothetical protein VP01_514g3 [Puccinia sorghi]
MGCSESSKGPKTSFFVPLLSLWCSFSWKTLLPLCPPSSYFILTCSISSFLFFKMPQLGEYLLCISPSWKSTTLIIIPSQFFSKTNPNLCVSTSSQIICISCFWIEYRITLPVVKLLYKGRWTRVILTRQCVHFAFSLASWIALGLPASNTKVAYTEFTPCLFRIKPHNSTVRNGDTTSCIQFLLNGNHHFKKKLAQLPEVDIQEAPARLPYKLHMFAYVDVLAQSLCILHSSSSFVCSAHYKKSCSLGSKSSFFSCGELSLIFLYTAKIERDISLVHIGTLNTISNPHKNFMFQGVKSHVKGPNVNRANKACCTNRNEKLGANTISKSTSTRPDLASCNLSSIINWSWWCWVDVSQDCTVTRQKFLLQVFFMRFKNPSSFFLHIHNLLHQPSNKGKSKFFLFIMILCKTFNSKAKTWLKKTQNSMKTFIFLFLMTFKDYFLTPLSRFLLLMGFILFTLSKLYKIKFSFLHKTLQFLNHVPVDLNSKHLTLKISG